MTPRQKMSILMLNTTYFDIFDMDQNNIKLGKSLRYVRINARTVVGIRSDMPDDQVRKKFNDNLKLSPYLNPKKFFMISKSRWI
jgi:hypothetical protein